MRALEAHEKTVGLTPHCPEWQYNSQAQTDSVHECMCSVGEYHRTATRYACLITQDTIQSFWIPPRMFLSGLFVSTRSHVDSHAVGGELPRRQRRPISWPRRPSISQAHPSDARLLSCMSYLKDILAVDVARFLPQVLRANVQLVQTILL